MHSYEILIYLLVVTIATVIGGIWGFLVAIGLLHLFIQSRRKPSDSSIDSYISTASSNVETTYKTADMVWDDYYSSVPLEYQLEYRAYLKSQEWKDLRKQVFKRDSHRCVRCGYIGYAKQCHHTNYRGIETMSFSIDQLETVCYGEGGCHERIHSGELPMKKTCQHT